MDRRFIDKQFQQLQKDTLAGRLRPDKDGDVSKADIGIRDRPDHACSYSLNHIQIALDLSASLYGDRSHETTMPAAYLTSTADMHLPS